MPPRHAIQTLLTACWLAVAGVPTVCLAQEGEQTPQEQAQAVSGIQSLADLVEDAKRPRPERFDAAVKLVAAGGSREALLAINAILGRGTGDASGARVLLEAMARTPVAPRELWASVSLVPVQDDPSVRARSRPRRGRSGRARRRRCSSGSCAMTRTRRCERQPTRR